MRETKSRPNVGAFSGKIVQCYWYHCWQVLSDRKSTLNVCTTKARLFPRLEIRRFSCSLAELFLAHHAHLLCQWNLGQYQRWLPSHFPFGWIATSGTFVVLFNTLWGASGEGGPILREGFLSWIYRCCDVCMLFCWEKSTHLTILVCFIPFMCAPTTLYSLIVGMKWLCCQNGVLFTPHPGSFWRVGPDFKWRFPVVDILML